MPRHTKKTHTSDTHPGSRAKKRRPSDEQQAEQHDEANKRRFVDRSTEGDGIAAQDLPGAEHGQNVVDPADEQQRLTPDLHGGAQADPDNYGDAGVRGQSRMSDADHHGGRKRN
jgi:hypothetical protein